MPNFAYKLQQNKKLFIKTGKTKKYPAILLKNSAIIWWIIYNALHCMISLRILCSPMQFIKEDVICDKMLFIAKNAFRTKLFVKNLASDFSMANLTQF